jgi:polar amino acid transport system substrate-binding protein
VKNIRVLRWIALLCASLPVSAATIRVLTEHLPPYQIDLRGEASGFATDLVRQTFKDAGVNYRIEFQSWSRAYQLALRDANTCIYSISKSEERQPLFHWIGELSYNTTAIYAMADRKDIVLQSLEQAKDYVIAVTKDDITHHYLLAHGFVEGKNLYVLENVASMLNVLSGRRRGIDLVILNDTILKYRAVESGLTFAEFNKLLVLPDLPLDFNLACNLKTPTDTVEKLRTSLQNIKTDGRFDKIVSGWSEQLQ